MCAESGHIALCTGHAFAGGARQCVVRILQTLGSGLQTDLTQHLDQHHGVRRVTAIDVTRFLKSPQGLQFALRFGLLNGGERERGRARVESFAGVAQQLQSVWFGESLASPAYLARRGTALHPDDLTGHECLSYFSFGKIQWKRS